MSEEERPTTRPARPESHEADPDHPGYSAAVKELDRILADLETGEPDVDVLAARVERAAFLVGVCRQRITAARLKVVQAASALDADHTG